ncbi:PREDICTED: cytosolic phospholipase A2 delta [Colobus angolensis palliatus]|uniref:cytosolic phospholipase A2 delta n=1 Tax=Colobus angolensis palliatus TaxID=336983 RepID=UPI0005F562F3|nr:PREDICTED: cytosolic phospholipase A2 delta [Colobus angolensis palliatus]
MESLSPGGPPGHPYQQEASACWQLTVRVLEARNLRRADLLSEADSYVILQLSTVPGMKFKTKTLTDTSHPVWNEAFHFLIQSQVKNVLELSIYDEDSVTEDDICFKVLYDISEVLPGKLLRKTFSQSPQGEEELDVEFLMEETSDRPENLITNKVLVARELSCLDVHLDSAGSTSVVADQDKLELELELKGSYEDTQTSSLGTTSAFRFHYMAALETELSGRLRSSTSNVWNGDNSARHLTVPLRPLIEKEVTMDVPAQDVPGVRLQLKAEGCSKELAVHLGFNLCAEEQAFLSRRKQVVAKALKQALQLDGDLQEDEVPIVGIMATGGGARAMTSLYGHLLALQKLGLLDCVTYLSGISGSTCLHCQYCTKLQCFPWDPRIIRTVMDQKLSGQRAALERGQNPLPLYLSLNVKENNLETLDFKEWVEFSPYEVGFLKYGAFVPPELFGSKFFMGRLMRRIPEPRICFLEAIWSNVFSLNLLDAWYDLTTSGESWKQHIKDKTRSLEKEPLTSLETSLCLEASWLQPGTALAQAFKGFLTGRPLHQCSPNFLQGLQLHQDYCSHKGFSTWADCQLDSMPSQLTPQEPQLCLVDAGYFINTSCPSMFRPGRRLNLILSFDYSLSAPFEALQQTELYCRARGLPFPRVEPSPQDHQQPRECHLFSDPACPEAPILLHFPLVNASFKDHSAPGVQRSPAELQAGQVNLTGATSPYALSNMTYKEEDFERLLQLSDYNVQTSQGAILQALRTALKHRALEARPPGAQI